MTIATQTRIFITLQATDMRKGFDGLSGLVSDTLKQDPLSGALFLFGEPLVHFSLAACDFDCAAEVSANHHPRSPVERFVARGYTLGQEMTLGKNLVSVLVSPVAQELQKVFLPCLFLYAPVAQLDRARLSKSKKKIENTWIPKL